MENRLYAQPDYKISILLHVLVLALLWGLSQSWLRLGQEQPARTILVEIDNSSTRQMVDSNHGELTEAPSPNAFLGKESRRVNRQTVARAQESVLQEASPPSTPKKSERVAPMPLAKFGVALPITTAQEQQDNKRNQDRDWSLFKQVQSTGVKTEYIKGVEDGAETALNTKEYVFFGYFERIRGQLDQAWRPLLKDHLLKLYKAGRELASNQDHITRLTVTLDSQGEITAVKVAQRSGTWNLDQAAVDAFNRAGPFPNPPKGLLEGKNTVDIRWDFILKT